MHQTHSLLPCKTQACSIAHCAVLSRHFIALFAQLSLRAWSLFRFHGLSNIFHNNYAWLFVPLHLHVAIESWLFDSLFFHAPCFLAVLPFMLTPLLVLVCLFSILIASTSIFSFTSFFLRMFIDVTSLLSLSSHCLLLISS